MIYDKNRDYMRRSIIDIYDGNYGDSIPYRDHINDISQEMKDNMLSKILFPMLVMDLRQLEYVNRITKRAGYNGIYGGMIPKLIKFASHINKKRGGMEGDDDSDSEEEGEPRRKYTEEEKGKEPESDTESEEEFDDDKSNIEYMESEQEKPSKKIHRIPQGVKTYLSVAVDPHDLGYTQGFSNFADNVDIADRYIPRLIALEQDILNFAHTNSPVKYIKDAYRKVKNEFNDYMEVILPEDEDSFENAEYGDTRLVSDDIRKYREGFEEAYSKATEDIEDIEQLLDDAVATGNPNEVNRVMRRISDDFTIDFTKDIYDEMDMVEKVKKIYGFLSRYNPTDSNNDSEEESEEEEIPKIERREKINKEDYIPEVGQYAADVEIDKNTLADRIKEKFNTGVGSIDEFIENKMNELDDYLEVSEGTTKQKLVGFKDKLIDIGKRILGRKKKPVLILDEHGREIDEEEVIEEEEEYEQELEDFADLARLASRLDSEIIKNPQLLLEDAAEVEQMLIRASSMPKYDELIKYSRTMKDPEKRRLMQNAIILSYSKELRTGTGNKSLVNDIVEIAFKPEKLSLEDQLKKAYADSLAYYAMFEDEKNIKKVIRAREKEEAVTKIIGKKKGEVVSTLDTKIKVAENTDKIGTLREKYKKIKELEKSGKLTKKQLDKYMRRNTMAIGTIGHILKDTRAKVKEAEDKGERHTAELLKNEAKTAKRLQKAMELQNYKLLSKLSKLERKTAETMQDIKGEVELEKMYTKTLGKTTEKLEKDVGELIADKKIRAYIEKKPESKDYDVFKPGPYDPFALRSVLSDMRFDPSESLRIGRDFIQNAKPDNLDSKYPELKQRFSRNSPRIEFTGHPGKRSTKWAKDDWLLNLSTYANSELKYARDLLNKGMPISNLSEPTRLYLKYLTKAQSLKAAKEKEEEEED